MIPQTYDAWRHCIEVDCGIPLTPAFIAARLQALSAETAEEPQRFARRYGAAHLQRVIGWFRAALSDASRA